MANSNHRAHSLREAEIELGLARHMLSRRRFATLSGILILLEDAATKCNAAGADPQSPLATAIRDLRAKTKRQHRNLLLTYGMIAAAVLVAGVMASWKLWPMPSGDSSLVTDMIIGDSPPLITNPRAGDAVDRITSVSGLSPKGSLPPGTQLYVLVKPQGFDYWLQSPPEVNTGWRVDNAGIGDKLDEQGTFRICAILTQQALSPDWDDRHDPDLPPGDAHCINVTRK